MSFEIKYDRDGSAAKNQSQEQFIQEQVIAQEQPQQYEAPQEVVQEVASEPQVTLYDKQQETDAQYNFRQLREAKTRSDRERDDALRMASELRSKYEQPKPVQEEDDIDLGQDDIAEGKHLKVVNNKYKKLDAEFREYKKQTQEQQKQNDLTATEVKVKSRYPDFDKVVSASNIEQLRRLYPEVANTISSSSDVYATAVSAYTVIKQLGIHKEDVFTEEKQKAQANALKPRPMNSIAPQHGDTPLSHANAFANGLTDTLKAQLQREMSDIRRNS